MPILLSSFIHLEPVRRHALKVITNNFIGLRTGLQACLQVLPPLEKRRDYQIQVTLAIYCTYGERYRPIRTNFFQLE